MTLIKIEQTGLTDIGNVRKANEDNFGFIEGKLGPIFTVCDGMGGHVGGATASKIAVKCILEYLASSDLRVPAVEINNAIVLANQEILETAAANPELKGMGTTCTVMLVINDSIHIGHVGDSRIYLLSDNKLHRITKDHSFVQNLVDSGAISDSEAESHPRKNELTRALGVRNLVEPTTNSNPIYPKQGDIFMLCSDGLCGLVTDSEMQNILNQNPQLDSASHALITAAKQAGGYDNITVQVAKVTESPYKTSTFPDFSPKENLSKTFYQAPYQEEVKIKPKFPKNISKTHWLVCGLIVLSLTSGFYLYQILKVKEIEVADPDGSPNPRGPKGGNGGEHGGGGTTVYSEDNDLYSCDSILSDGSLVHLVAEGEVYGRVHDKHQAHYENDYNFTEVVYEDKTAININNITTGKKLKWKKNKNAEPVAEETAKEEAAKAKRAKAAEEAKAKAEAEAKVKAEAEAKAKAEAEAKAKAEAEVKSTTIQ